MANGVETKIYLKDTIFNLNQHNYHELYFDKGMPAMNIKVYTNAETGEIGFGLAGLQDIVLCCPDSKYEVLEDRGYETFNVSEIIRNLVNVLKYETDKFKISKLKYQINSLDYLQEKISEIEDDLVESL